MLLILKYFHLLQKPRDAQGEVQVQNEILEGKLDYDEEKRLGFRQGDQTDGAKVWGQLVTVRGA